MNIKKGFIFLLLVIFTLHPSMVNARSGCCSHHGGVCGCRCCDGSPLSSKCAQYYPQCNGDGAPPSMAQEEHPVYIPPPIKYIPPPNHMPTITPTPSNTPTPFPTNTSTITLKPTYAPTPPKVLKQGIKINPKIKRKRVKTKPIKKNFWQWVFGK